jgi:hypothetical protein
LVRQQAGVGQGNFQADVAAFGGISGRPSSALKVEDQGEITKPDLRPGAHIQPGAGGNPLLPGGAGDDLGIGQVDQAVARPVAGNRDELGVPGGDPLPVPPGQGNVVGGVTADVEDRLVG